MSKIFSKKFLLISILLIMVLSLVSCTGEEELPSGEEQNPEQHVHTFGEWTTEKEPTCSETGVRKRSCTGCDEVETETIEVTAHSYSKNVVAPTVDSEGYTVFTCTVCGYTYKGDYVSLGGADRLKFTLFAREGGEVYAVTGYSEPEGASSTSTRVFVPAQHDGKPVVAISGNGFQNSSVTSVTLPDTITEIGSKAFYGCTSLQEFTLPPSVTKLSDYMFYNCSSLRSVSLNENVTSFGKYTFYGCEQLKALVLPDSLTSIEEYAFYGCKNLNIENSAFPDAITKIGAYAFSGCVALEGRTQLCLTEYYSTGKTTSCDCDPIAALFRDEGVVTAPSASQPVSAEYVEAFDSVGELFTAAVAGVNVSENVFSFSLSPTDGAYNDYNAFFRAIKQLFNSSKDSVSHITEYKITDGAVIGVNTPLLLTAKTGDKKKEEGKTIGSYRAALAKLWTDDVDTFVRYASTLADTYHQNESAQSPEDLGAICTKDGLFIIPFAAEIADKDTLLGCFFIDEQGNIYCWVSDMSGILSLDRTQADFSVRIHGKCTLFGIPTLMLSEKLESIETSAFDGCKNIQAIKFSQTLKSVGESAFSGCEKIEEIVLPSTVTSLSKGVFRNCTGLKTATVGTLPDYLFYGCTSLEEFTVSSQIKEVGLSALYNCENVKEIVLPSTVTKISDAAFYNCKSACSVSTLPALVEIGSTSFSGCESLAEIDLPETLTKIGSWAFERCASFETITIPSKITKIDWGVFRNCVALTSIVLPEEGEDVGIKEIANAAFENCSSLKSITTPSALGNDPSSEKITLPSALTKIDPSVFAGCTSLTTIEIPESVTSIGDSAFAGCTGLTSMTIDVKELEASAFSGCTGLTSVTLSSSVQKIGPAVFAGCNSLTSLTIPFVGNRAGVTSTDKNQYPFGYIFGTKAYDGGVKTTQQFYGVTFSSLSSETYYIPATLKNVVVTGGNVLYGAFTYCVDLVSIDIDALETTSIEGNAFSHCEKLSTFTVPDTVTYLGDEVFYACGSLTALTVSENVTSIGKDVFYNCPIQTAVVPTVTLAALPKKVLQNLTINGGKTIVDNALMGAEILKNITISDTVEFVGQNAFDGCGSLVYNKDDNGYSYLGNEENKFIILMGTVATGGDVCNLKETTKFIYDEAFIGRDELSEIVFPQGLLNVGSNTFRGVSATLVWHPSAVITRIAPYAFAEYAGEDISIPNTIVEICEHAFDHTSARLNWVEGNGITAIGDSAFEGYLGTTLTIPRTVKTIGVKAFAYCIQLVSLTVPDSVVSVGENAFLDCRLTEISMPTTAIDLVPKRTLKKVTLTRGDYIGAGAFADATSLTELVICDSVSYIGANAFANCPIFSISMPTIAIPSISKKYLKTVVLTSGVSIEKDAFADAVDLVSITLPSTLESIGNNAFLNCQKLVEICNYSTVIILEKGSEKDGGIAYYAKNVCDSEADRRVKVVDDFIIYEEQEEKVLMGYGGLNTDVDVPTGTTRIYEYAFRNCVDIISVTLPNTVKEVGEAAFFGCSSLVSMTVPFVSTSETSYSPFGQIFGAQEYVGGKRTIQRYTDKDGGAHEAVFYIPHTLENVCVLAGEVSYGAFSGCDTLKSVVLPDSSTILGDYALYNCSSLEGVISVPKNAESIGKEAFTNCVRMTGVRIYGKVKRVGENAFANCNALKENGTVYNDGTMGSWCDIEFENVNSNPLGLARNMEMNGAVVTHFVVPEGVTIIRQYQFMNATFSNVDIPDTVVEIGASAFDGCSNLRSITIPNSVPSADKIGQNAFNACPIEDASIPTYAMEFMPKGTLQRLTLTTGTVIAANALKGCQSLTSVDFRSDITTINANAFSGCSNLTALSLPDSVEEVDNDAFYGCHIAVASIPTIAMLAIPREYLTEITLTTGTVIAENALNGCSNLESVDFISAITTIESHAFYGCGKLKSIMLPDTVTSIESDAFEGCSFTTISVPIGVIESIPKDDIQELTLVAARGDVGVMKAPVPSNAFASKTSLKKVYIGDGITGIGSEAFSGCVSLEEFIVRESNSVLKTIGEQAFYGCIKLTSLSLGANLETIEESAFFNCGKNVTMNVVTLPSTLTEIGINAFSGCAATITWATGSSIETITTGSFAGYAGTQFTIPESVTTIEGCAFEDCTRLTGISVPNTVTTIGMGAFKGCIAMTGIALPFIGNSASATGQASLFGYIFGTETYEEAEETVQQYLVAQEETDVTYYLPKTLKTVRLQGNVTELNYCAFSNCEGLNMIVLPENLSAIGQYAFKNCTAGIDWNGNNTYSSVASYSFAEYKGNSLNIPASVTSLEEKAFYNCKAQLVWDDDIELASIGGYVFENYKCDTLSLPSSVTAVAGYAFYGCTSEIDWSNANVTTFVEDLFHGYAGDTITVPNKVTTIESFVFNACVAEIKWESPIETFSEGLFGGYGDDSCIITIPSTVTVISRNTFAYCSAKVIWDDGSQTERIESNAFDHFLSTEISIPSSVVTIEKNAFISSSLQKLTIGGNDDLDVDDDAFDGCRFVTVSIPTLAIHAVPKDDLKTAYITSGAEIPQESFSLCPKLEKVFIGEGITSIGNEAFSLCVNLLAVIVPLTIEHIGNSVFDGCSKLKTFDVDGSSYLGNIDLTTFNQEDNSYEFYGSSANRFIVLLKTEEITNVTDGDYSGLLTHGTGNETRIIYQNVFERCTNIAAITIPSSVVEIGEYAFYERTVLAQLQFENDESQLKYIGANAFAGCTELTTLELPTGLIRIATEAFAGCTQVGNITIPASVTEIGQESFKNCSTIEILSFAEGSDILQIEAGAFAGCVNLTTATIPNGLESMGAGVFSGCKKLATLSIPFVGGSCEPQGAGSTTLFGYIFGTETYDGSTSVTQHYSATGSATYRIPASLQNVNVTDGNILYGAFYNCSSIKKFTLSSVKKIGDKAFYNCSGVNTVLTVPESITEIGSNAFEDFSENATGVEIESLTSWCAIEFKNETANPLSAVHVLVDGSDTVTELVLPDDVEAVGQYAFYGCTSIKKITIPAEVSEFGEKVFYGCTGLSASGVYYVGTLVDWCAITFDDEKANPLSYGHSLYVETDVCVIGESVTTLNIVAEAVGDYAFFGASYLTEIVVENDVTSIGIGAFGGCTSLIDITLPFVGGSEEQSASASTLFGYIFGSAYFSGASSVTQYYGENENDNEDYWIPNTLRTVNVTGGEIFYGAFYGCQMLTEVTLPERLTAIEEKAFYRVNLTSIYLPSSMNEIGEDAFEECTVTKLYYASGINDWCAITFSNANANPLNMGEGDVYISEEEQRNLSITAASINDFAFYNWRLDELTLSTSTTFNGTVFDYMQVGTLTATNTQIALIPRNYINTLTVTGSAAIQESLMSGMNVLQTVVIQNTVPSIGASAFFGCSSLTSITLGSGITSIGASAFSGCSNVSINDISMPQGLNSIGASAFYHCKANIIWAENAVIQVLGTSSFAGYWGDNFTIPTNVKTIGAGAFEDCIYLESDNLYFNASLSEIGNSAFKGCISEDFTSIEVPSSVETIGEGAFNGCRYLTSISLPFVGGSSNASSATESTLFGYIFGTLNYDGGSLTTQKYGQSSTATYYIPDTLTTVEITGSGDICYGAFYDCGNIVNLTLSSSVQSIGACAFYNCGSVANLTLSSSVQNIGEYAFYNCGSLESFVVPTSVRTIGSNAFGECSGLATVTYSGNISDWCIISFADNGANPLTKTGVDSLTLGTPLTANVTLQSGVTVIPASTFKNTNIESITLPSGITAIGDDAFSGCSSLETIRHLGTVSDWCAITFGSGSSNPLLLGDFSAENKLLDEGNEITGSVVIEEGVTVIPYATFMYTTITYIQLPSSLETVSQLSFTDCDSLLSVNYLGSVSSWCLIDFKVDELTQDDPNPLTKGNVNNLLINGSPLTGDVTITGAQTFIPAYTFKNAHIGNLTLPSTIATFGKGAFKGCTVSGRVLYPINSIVNWCKTTFVDSDSNPMKGGVGDSYLSLSNGNKFTGEITLDGSVTTIPEKTFMNSEVTRINLPTSVEKVGKDAFLSCASLERVYYSGDLNGWCGLTFESVYANPLYYGHNLYFNNTKVTTIDMSTISKTSIGASTFAGWHGTTITIGSDIESISGNAFNGCNASIVWNNPNIERIGASAFFGYNGASFTIPTTITEIEANAFESSSLTSIEIPESVETIGSNAFYSCHSLAEINILSNGIVGNSAFGDCPIETATIPSNAIAAITNKTSLISLIIRYGDSIAESACEDCTSLTSLTINDNTISTIGESAFSGCTNLDTVIIADSVVTVGTDAFKGCHVLTATMPTAAIEEMSKTHLATLTITSGTSIVENAFKNCTTLTTVTVADSVTSVGTDAFSGCHIVTATIPTSAIEAIGMNKMYLETLVITSGNTIAANACENCVTLENITIANTVTTIGEDAFVGCNIVEAHMPILAISYIPQSSLETVELTAGTSIPENAFKNCTTLKNITIANTVTTIGNYAFSGCTGVTSFTIPHLVTSIGRYAFQNCTAGVTWNSPTITSIGNNAFRDYKGNMSLPSTLTSIGNYAFYNCTSLTNLVIPSGVESIGQSAFYNYRGTTITLPGSVTDIYSSAFNSCSNLNRVYYTGTIASWCKIAFDGSTSNPLYYAHDLYINNSLQTSINISGTTTIKSNAFYNWSGTSVTVSSSVTTIGSGAFSGCTSLQNITISDSVTTIGSDAFSNCPIETATMPTTAISAITNKSYLTTLTLTSGTSIAENAFNNCTNLTTVTIANTVTSIGSGAFTGCPIKTATMPTTAISSIPQSKLRKVAINGGTSIAASAFRNCTTLFSVSIASTVTSIRNNAFEGCYYLAEVHNRSSLSISAGNTNNGYVGYYAKDIYTSSNFTSKLTVTNDGYIRHDNGTAHTLIGYLGTGTSLTVPTDITAINKYAFAPCSGLTSVTLPATVTSIGQYAFQSCSASINWTSPTITTIGQYAFYGYAGTSLALPNGVTEIGTHAFDGCQSLTSLSIPDTVATIGASAYNGCNNLQKYENEKGYYLGNSTNNYVVFMSAKNASISSVTIDSVTKAIYDNAFSSCSSLATLVIPDSVTSVGTGAFSGCPIVTATIPTAAISVLPKTSLTTLTITSGTSIAANAFSTASNLTTVTIANTVTSIGSGAFSGCPITTATMPTTAISYIPKTNLTTVVLNGGEFIADNAFQSCSTLLSITIPSTVTSIAWDAFQYCYRLVEVYNKSNLPITKGADSYGYIGKYAKKVTQNTESFTSKVELKGDYYLYIDNSTASVVNYIGSATTLSVPSSIDNKSITSINQYAFYGYAGTSLTLPNGVTEIGTHAFDGCQSLTSLSIPDTVATIGSDVFNNCTSLTYYDYDNGYYLGNSTHNHIILIKAKNASIESLTTASTTKFIYANAFKNCSSLATLTITDSVTSIGTDAFSGCPIVTASIPTLAIEYMTKSNLKTLTLTSGSSIEANAFQNCSTLTEVNMENTITQIGSNAFNSCTNLLRVTLSANIVSIAWDAFQYCYRLVEVYNKSNLPITKGADSYGYVGYYAKDVYTSEYTSKIITEIDGFILYDIGDGKKSVIAYTGSSTSVTIPSDQNITTIEQYAFYKLTTITSLVIPTSVTSISGGALSGCTSLQSITIPFVGRSKTEASASEYTLFGYIFGTTNNGGKAITQRYANNSSSSKTYYIPSNLQTVTVTGGPVLYGAFYGCTMLRYVTIGENVTSLGPSTFYNCSNLSTVTFEHTEGWFRSTSATSTTSVSNITVTNASTNASNFRGSTYRTYYIRRE